MGVIEIEYELNKINVFTKSDEEPIWSGFPGQFHPVFTNRIVILCKDSKQRVIVSLLKQVGWKSKIQSIVTESDLIQWFEKSLRGKYSETVGAKMLKKLEDEITVEFPATDVSEFRSFLMSGVTIAYRIHFESNIIELLLQV